MNESFIEFMISDAARFDDLSAVFVALQRAKQTGDFQDDDYWLRYFDKMARSYFWWPVEAKLADWQSRWDAASVSERLTNPSLIPGWSFGSMIDAIREGEFELVNCVRISGNKGRIEFTPLAGPYGGADCLHALVESFGCQVTAENST